MKQKSDLMMLNLMETEFMAFNRLIKDIDSLVSLVRKLPPEFDDQTSKNLKTLRDDMLVYRELLTEAVNITVRDTVELQRQRDFLMDLVLRMLNLVHTNDVKCMNQFVIEMRHMFLEGMFYTEMHTYKSHNSL